MQIKIRTVVLCFLVVCTFWIWLLISDRRQLNEELIRLHVVANSDSRDDQAVKLQVRDAVIRYLQDTLSEQPDVYEAKAYLEKELPNIQKLANDTLAAAEKTVTAGVSICKERFGVRHYESFSLPAGVYESLRVTIGEGDGENWWCVVFPSLCYSAAGEEFEEVAAGAGFSEELVASMEGKNPIEIRFFLLDLLGKLENMLFRGGI